MNKRLGTRMGLFAATLMASGLAFTAQAADWNGLGAPWPTAPDVSRSAAFHAYKWEARGVAYIQINGADGAPLAAVAVASGQVIVLPIGRQDAVVVVPSETASGGAVVFDDGAVSVQQAGGGFQVRMAPASECSDPIECGKVTTFKATAVPQATSAAEEPCKDPIECGKVQ